MIPRRVVGLDILPGSSPAGGEPLFAAVVVSGDRVLAEYESVKLSEIPVIVERHSAEALALDNIYELAPDEDALAAFLKRNFEKIPRLIETTLINGERYSIETLCMAAGLCRGKPSPLETAKINAFLARRGVGSEVLIFEEETRITVARGRVPGQGGMSRERYKRNIELLVLRKTREIEERLRRAGIDYDLFVRKSGAGLEGATFIVYAARGRLNGIVKRARGYDLTVQVEPVKREKISYIPLKGRRREFKHKGRPLIVGVDPGMSTGIAILDFKGRVLLLTTKRWAGRNQLAELFHEYGKPAVIAADVNPPPGFVKKLAASLKAKLYYPPRSLTLEEKRTIAARVYERQGAKSKDSHQRDALAAAIKAYQNYRVKFEQVEREAVKLDVPVDVEEAKLLVLRGFSVAEALQRLVRRKLDLTPPPPTPQQKHEVENRAETLLAEYRRRLNLVMGENLELRERLRELREELVRERELRESLLSMKRENLEREKEYSKLRIQVDTLREKISELEETLSKLHEKLSLYEEAMSDIYTGKKKVVARLGSSTLARLEANGNRVVVVDDDSIEELGVGKVTRTLKALAGKRDSLTILLRGEKARRLEAMLYDSSLILALMPEDSVKIGDYYLVDTSKIRRVKRENVDLKGLLLAYREERKRELLGKANKA